MLSLKKKRKTSVVTTQYTLSKLAHDTPEPIPFKPVIYIESEWNFDLTYIHR